MISRSIQDSNNEMIDFNIKFRFRFRFYIVIQPRKGFKYFTDESENSISPGFKDFTISEKTISEVVPVKALM